MQCIILYIMKLLFSPLDTMHTEVVGFGRVIGEEVFEIQEIKY